ncbi:MAG: hypothetical protein ACQR33_01515 [Candidatus Saccharibacteria bacterium]
MRKNKPAKIGDAPQKVFDVSRPGKTSAGATSRPVIVGHKPQVKDPMMSGRSDDRPLLDSTKKVTLAVPADVELAAQPQLATDLQTPADTPVSPDATTSDQLQTPAPSDDLAALVTSAMVESPVPAPQSTSMPDAASGPQASPISAPQIPAEQPPQAEQPARPENATTGVIFDENSATPDASQPTEASANAEPLPTLTDEPIDMAAQAKIVVSHHNYSNGWVKFFITFVILAIIAVVVIDILLDSGLIVKNGIPHTHFF